MSLQTLAKNIGNKRGVSKKTTKHKQVGKGRKSIETLRKEFLSSLLGVHVQITLWASVGMIETFCNILVGMPLKKPISIKFTLSNKSHRKKRDALQKFFKKIAILWPDKKSAGHLTLCR